MPQNSGEGSQFSKLCVPANLIRETPFSDVFRAEFSLNGQKSLWDIERIMLPFREEKKQDYMIRFHISENEMQEEYKAYRAAIKQHLSVGQSLCAKSRAASRDAADKVSSCTVFYKHREVFSGENTTEIYIITPPAEPYVGSSFFSGSEIRVSRIIQTGLRLLQTAKIYNELSVHIGAFDLERLFVAVSGDGRKLIQNNSFFSATAEQEEHPELSALKAHTKAAGIFMKPEIALGTEQPSFSGDIYSVCALMWTLLDGRSHTEPPVLAYVPQYSFDDLTACLVMGLEQGESAYRELTKGLRDILKALQENSREDTLIHLRVPEYIGKQEAARQEREQERKRRAEETAAAQQAEIDAQREAEEKSRKKKKRKRLAAVLLITLAVLASAAAACTYLIPKIYPRQAVPTASPMPTAAATEPPTPSPSQEPEPEKAVATPSPTPSAPVPTPSLAPSAPVITPSPEPSAPVSTVAPVTTSVPSGGGGTYTPTPTYTQAPVTPAPAVPPTPTAPPYTEPEGMFFIIQGEFKTSAEITLHVGDTYSVCPSVSCTWSCSDPSAASIDKTTGQIVAYAPGICVITAHSEDGKTASLTVTVI